MVALLSGCSGNERSTQNGADSKSECPSQGLFQSDVDYCRAICEVQSSPTYCKSVCEFGERIDDEYATHKLQDKIQQYKCKNCGEDCTPELLDNIEKAEAEQAQKEAQQNEQQRLYSIRASCRDKCKEEAVSQIGADRCYVYPDQPDGTTTQQCDEILIKCINEQKCNELT
jgi:hypothetical protein